MKRIAGALLLTFVTIQALSAESERPASVMPPSFTTQEYDELAQALRALEGVLRNPDLVAAARLTLSAWSGTERAFFVGHILSSAGYPVAVASGSEDAIGDAWLLVESAVGQRIVWFAVRPRESSDPAGVLGSVAIVESDGGWVGDPACYQYAAFLDLPPNAPPVIVMARRLVKAKAERVTWFSARGSYDPDGAILLYSWDFGDGEWATTREPVASHEYDEAGIYEVTLTAYDAGGAFVRISIPIHVEAGCGCS